jgi:hypothetical protein
VAWILVVAVKQEMVFGCPLTDQIEAATQCWDKLPGKCIRPIVSYRRAADTLDRA